MDLLSVPYKSQINNHACGAAALEMVYKFYGFNDVSQQEIVNQYQEFEPHGSGNLCITTDNLVEDARKRGFHSEWKRANLNLQVDDLLTAWVNSRMPIIVCQKYTDEQPLLGHCRVFLGFDGQYVNFHDPCTETGGSNLRWPKDKFVDFWKATGKNVTGGVYVIISHS